MKRPEHLELQLLLDRLTSEVTALSMLIVGGLLMLSMVVIMTGPFLVAVAFALGYLSFQAAVVGSIGAFWLAVMVNSVATYKKQE